MREVPLRETLLHSIKSQLHSSLRFELELSFSAWHHCGIGHLALNPTASELQMYPQSVADGGVFLD